MKVLPRGIGPYPPRAQRPNLSGHLCVQSTGDRLTVTAVKLSVEVTAAHDWHPGGEILFLISQEPASLQKHDALGQGHLASLPSPLFFVSNGHEA